MSNYLALRNSESFRFKLALSCIRRKPFSIDLARISEKDNRFLNLLNALSGYQAESENVNGIFKFRPGQFDWAENVVSFQFGEDANLAYFVEPLVIIGLFSNTTLRVNLFGITVDGGFPSLEDVNHELNEILDRFIVGNHQHFSLVDTGHRIDAHIGEGDGILQLRVNGVCSTGGLKVVDNPVVIQTQFQAMLVILAACTSNDNVSEVVIGAQIPKLIKDVIEDIEEFLGVFPVVEHEILRVLGGTRQVRGKTLFF